MLDFNKGRQILLISRGYSLVSSLMMGLAYGLGGAMARLIGRLADYYSAATVLGWLAFVPLVTIPLIVLFPRQDAPRKAG